ncbi:hypothetical protein BJV74DRAFT_854873 [Russula compacta]|nr:hypothetical protein BJV74DRAFT_854873 [Russula compacta]
MLERAQRKVARGEQTVEIVHAIAVDLDVQAPDARGVRRHEGVEGRETVVAHEDRKGEVERHVSRTLDETSRGAEVVVLADDGPERGGAECDEPPAATDVRGGDDERAGTEEAKDVDENLRREAVDRSQVTPQYADLPQHAIDERFCFCELVCQHQTRRITRANFSCI